MNPSTEETPTANQAYSSPLSPLREIMLIAVPTILQMASYTIQQFTDIVMLSRVSDVHATAAGNGGLVAWCFMSFGFGMLFIVNAMAGQAFGAGRKRECGEHLWQGIWLGLIYAGLLTVPSVMFGHYVFDLFNHSPQMTALETEYFWILMTFLVVKMMSAACGQFLLAIDRPNVVLLAAVSGVVVNIVSNYILIYGHFGMPAMGVAGAAWGTNIGGICELLILVFVAFSPKVRQTYNSLAWRFNRAKFSELVRVGIPSGLQTTGDIAAWTIFLVGVMARYGEAALAANNYMMQYMKLSFMPAFGFGTAVSVLVARYVGAGKPDVAKHRAHLGFKITAVYMVACGLLFLTMPGALMRLFTTDPEVIRIGKILFIFCAIYQFADAAFIIYSSALRGVKDTLIPSIVQISLCWSLVVGGGVLVSIYAPQLGVGGPWAIGAVYGAILGVFLFLRFKNGAWQHATASPDEPRTQ